MTRQDKIPSRWDNVPGFLGHSLSPLCESSLRNQGQEWKDRKIWKNEKTQLCVRPRITYSGHPQASAKGETPFFKKGRGCGCQRNPRKTPLSAEVREEPVALQLELRTPGAHTGFQGLKASGKEETGPSTAFRSCQRSVLSSFTLVSRQSHHMPTTEVPLLTPLYRSELEQSDNSTKSISLRDGRACIT